jgi:hypothetical protein
MNTRRTFGVGSSLWTHPPAYGLHQVHHICVVEVQILNLLDLLGGHYCLDLIDQCTDLSFSRGLAAAQ